jgi:peptidyl-prolyl cis-trans isomerase D
MQIIQNIRDKGSAIVIGVIAVSLVGFLLMDANSGGGKLFGGSKSTVIGNVNGEEIEAADFSKRVTMVEEQSGTKTTGAESYRMRQNVWDQVVAEKIFISEIEKVGITFSPEEMSSILYSSEEAPQTLKQAFTDPQTGVYDVEKVKEWWKQAKKSKDEDLRKLSAQVIDPMRITSLYTKYNSMITGAAYYPAWMQEMEAAENTTFANITYASIPYNVISDSAVKVTDEDINAYVSKRKKLFKQEAGRVISYVSFNANPSLADTNKTRDAVAAMRTDFANDSSAKNFVARNVSTIPYYDGFVLKSKMQMAAKDSIAATGVGNVFGPYLDGGNYVLAKMMATRTMPDSIKCRHILIKIADAQTGNVRPDSVARKLIDSIKAAIGGGADFNAMVIKYSDDGGSKETKGEYKFSSTSSLVDSFYRTVFYEPVGTKKIVKGESGGQQGYIGYHYIEVLEQWKLEPAYKVAYMAKDIIPSDETINNANIQATKLAGSARTLKQLDDYVAKNGLSKVSNPVVIKENDYELGNLQSARDIVRWAFDAKQGEVSAEAFNLENQYVVAVLEKIQPEGTPDAKTARPMVEAEVRNRKKADEILKKITAGMTPEAAAALYNKTVQTAGADSTLTFGAFMIPGIGGSEPKLIGAAFNKENQTKPSAPVAGTFGVYVVKVNSYGTKAAATAEEAEQKRTQRLQSMKQQAGAWFNALKEQATIKDKHNTFN